MIVYSNCQKKKSAISVISKHVLLENNIIAITEPWVGAKCKATFKPPWKVQCSGIDARAVLVTPPWANAFALAEFSDKDSVFSLINIGDLTLIIGVIYAEGGMLDSSTWIDKINDLISICGNVLIFSDTNAHSVLWGYPQSDSKGKKWEEILSLTGLDVFTDRYAATFQNSRGFESCIDIALGTPNIKALLSDRILNVLPTLSDHKVWGISLNKHPEITQSVQLKLKSTDWKKFNQSLEVKLSKLKWDDNPNSDKLSAVVNELIDTIKVTIEENIEKSTIKPKVRWWNAELTSLKNNLENENRIEVKEVLRKDLEQKILEAQANDWKLFASTCISVSDAFLKNKLLNMEKKDTMLHPIKKDDGSMTSSGEETAHEMLKYWFTMKSNISDSLKETERRINNLMPIHSPSNEIVEITEDSVYAAIHSMRPFSAPSFDGIPNIVLQKAAHLLVPKLTLIYNECMKLGFTPGAWKQGKVILLPKGNKITNTVKDFRPITLLPVTVKVFEKIVLKRLQQLASDKNWISKEQFGFQPGRSATHALVDYSSKISSCLKSKTPVVGIHLDLEGAFDSVWKPILIKRLLDFDCPGYLVNWLCDYLSNRVQIYESPTFTAEVNVQKSTPQGGSLSPFLWSLIIDPLITKLRDRPIEVSVFADDISIIISKNTWFGIGRMANDVLQSIDNWAKTNALRFNPAKSTYIQYSRQRTVPEIELFMNGVKLKRSNQVKVLGVIFTERLNWRSHITYVVNKAIKNLFRLGAIVNRNWGMNGKYLRTLYLGAIEPIMLYSCSVWASDIPKEGVRKQLSRVQRIAGQMITRCNSKTHQLDILTLAGIMPLHIRAKELSLRWWTGVSIDRDNPCERAFQDLKIHKEISTHFSSIEQLDNWSRLINITKDNMDMEYSALKTRLKPLTPDNLIDCSLHTQLSQFTDNYLRIYTDGSKSHDGVGAACTIWKDGVEIDSWGCSLDEDTSVFKAELLAIAEAVKISMSASESVIEIVSDSQSVLTALKSPSQNAKIEDLRQDIIRINEKKSVRLIWTRAHVGEAGNERADALAKKIAATRPTCMPSRPDRLDLLRKIKKQANWEWQILWESRRGQWSFKWKDKVDKKMRVEQFKNYEAELLNNFMAGSIPLNQKMHLWGLKDTPNCDCDDVTEETPRHYLFVCRKQASLREEIQRNALVETGNRALSCKVIFRSDFNLNLLVSELIKRFPP